MPIGTGTLIALIVGSIVSTLVGGATSAYSAHKQSEGQKEANKANQDLFAQEMAYNSAEAQKNRDFQLYMSNTAHQREITDLKKAGLNPWLSVSGAGAPVASGSSASSSSPDMENTGIDLSGVASALNSIKDIALIGALSSRYGSNGRRYR